MRCEYIAVDIVGELIYARYFSEICLIMMA